MNARTSWLGLALLCLAVAVHGAEIPAFPAADGFGATTAGGRGGKVIEVTNLNDSGPGSLREACFAEGPRIVVFRVGGIIELETDIKISNGFITIAGQTAPTTWLCASCAAGPATARSARAPATATHSRSKARACATSWWITAR